MKDLAIVVHSMDSYSKFWKGFFYYFDKYWDEKIICKKYFLTENKKYDHKNFINIRTGKGEWSDRLKRGLSCIKEDNVLYLQEDFWLKERIDNSLMENIYLFFKEKDLNIFKMHHTQYRYIETDESIDKHKLYKIKTTSAYLVSHQMSLWKKDFFLFCLFSNENPWDNEKKGTKRLKQFFENKDCSKMFGINYDYYWHVGSKGEFNHKGIELLKKMMKGL